MNERARPSAPAWCHAFLFVVILALFIPVIAMVVGSFYSEGALTLKWYQAVFQDRTIIEALYRSLMLGVFSSVVSTLLGLTAAISIQKSKLKWVWLIESFSVLSLVLPELVFALALLSWFVLIGFQLSLVTVIIAHVTFSLSFSLFIISSRLVQLDAAMDDAAQDLGATELQTLLRVTIPLLKPAIGASLLICFLLSFDDFLISYFVSGVGADTLPIKLYSSMKMGHTPKLNALSSLMLFFSLGSLILLFRLKSIRRLVSK